MGTTDPNAPLARCRNWGVGETAQVVLEPQVADSLMVIAVSESAERSKDERNPLAGMATERGRSDPYIRRGLAAALGLTEVRCLMTVEWTTGGNRPFA